MIKIIKKIMNLPKIAAKTTFESSKAVVTWIMRPISDVRNRQYCTATGSPGSGANKGGTGGSIKEAGGGMGRLATAQEEGYFYNKEKEKLKKLKKELIENAEQSQNKQK